MEEQRIPEIDFSTAPKELIEVLLDEYEDTSIFTEIANANMNRHEILMLLLENPDIPEDAKKLISDTLHVHIAFKEEVPKVKTTPEVRSLTLLQRMQKMSFGDKRLLALRGGKEVRSILMKDPNREIVLAVLDNPKITETEIEVITKSRSAPEEVIRKIIRKREWMKNYTIVLSIVSNPKTPAGNAVPLISELKTKDLTILSKSKNISEAVRIASRRLLQSRKGS